eukprot:GHVS01088890.1.p2 GENE.GHVS01088890.1~~GHVS01088890.1.p2  ORF type:complete len:110 (+),score=27.28 GHVS01088890.1:214-543(+)
MLLLLFHRGLLCLQSTLSFSLQLQYVGTHRLLPLDMYSYVQSTTTPQLDSLSTPEMTLCKMSYGGGGGVPCKRAYWVLQASSVITILFVLKNIDGGDPSSLLDILPRRT